jgi:hypothetical protein
MKDIHIDKKPFSTDLYYSGVFTDRNNKEFEFTLTQHDNGLSIGWLNDHPMFREASENIIIEHFKNNN